MDELKIISYNLFRGAQATMDELISFLKQEDPDVICLQEINEWHINDFEMLMYVADRTGMRTYVYGDSNTDYKLATLSKHPIITTSVYKNNIWHSLIDCSIEVKGRVLRVVNVHLNPHAESSRAIEIEHLLSQLSEDTPTIIVGDFNSISREDNYPENLLSKLKTAGIDKFSDSELLYDTTDLLKEANYIDMAADLSTITNTVPTTYNTDKNHLVPLRLDYAYSNRALHDSIANVSVIKSDLTNQISDHYPLSITIQLNRNEV